MNTKGKKSKSDDEAPKGGCNGNGGMQGSGRGSGKVTQNNNNRSKTNVEQPMKKLRDYLLARGGSRTNENKCSEEHNHTITTTTTSEQREKDQCRGNK